MKLKPYHDGATYTSHSAVGRNIISKRSMQGGLVICVISLIFLAVVPAPQRFLAPRTVRRTLAATDPTAYFEDYHRFLLDGRQKTQRRAQDDNTMDAGSDSSTMISIHESRNGRRELQQANSPPPTQAPDVVIITEHEKVELEKLEVERQNNVTRPVEGIIPVDTISSAPSVTPSNEPSLAPLTAPTQSKPNVFVFYVKRRRNLAEEDEQLMQAWTHAWQSSGYNARVLTIDDAVQHPEYVAFSDDIDAILTASSVYRPEELKACYLRYLAMSVAGGGMMVDLDMTPKNLATATNTTVPDKFTMYCNFETPNPKMDWIKQVETQSGLPCAAVAPSGEWLRVGKLMGWVAKQHLDQRVWTDAHALQFLTNYDEISLEKREMAQSWRTSGWDRCHLRYV